MDTLTLKPLDDAGEELMLRLFEEVRSEDLGMTCWDPSMRDQILRMQLNAQRRSYAEEHPSADWRLIYRGGVPIGWVVVERGAAALLGVDIALVPNERSRGVGTAVIRALQTEAAQRHQPMLIAVLRDNVRAAALYGRLGFRVVDQNATHAWMEWRDD